MQGDFALKGFNVLRNFLTHEKIAALNTALRQFHTTWLAENPVAFAQGAINSAHLTRAGSSHNPARQALFDLIGSAKFMQQVKRVLGANACFMNTQLFFDPLNGGQRNYWHRDSQYHLSLSEQQESLSGPQVVHFRIPLVDERGIEAVPGSHKRWDTPEELDVRLARNNRKPHHDLSTGEEIALNAGDLCVFSAAMIHRGLYGLDRFALDILLCDPAPELLQFVDKNCLPTEVEISGIENPSAFLNTLAHF